MATDASATAPASAELRDGSARIGLISPIVTRIPSVASAWEASAGIGELARIAQVADRLGYAHLTCSEHIVVPHDGAAQRGAVFWDPLATFGYLAARTERIRLATQILVLGLHHPLEIAKRYGTLDLISGGRLVLGVGLGSVREEFDLVDATFAGRAKRADEAMQALRSGFGRARPEFSGEHYAYSQMIVEPHGLQQQVPMWVGGRSRASLVRAVAYGDGWVPTDLDGATIRALLAEIAPPPGFEVLLGTGVIDPGGAPDRARAAMRAAREAGATTINVTIGAESASHYCEQLAALAELTG